MQRSLLLLAPALFDAAVYAPGMPTKEIAPGVKMPAVSAGTWTSGSKFKDHAYDIVTNWLDLGYRGIDTAFNYFDQRPIAKAIKKSGIDRKDLFITSKIPFCESFTAGYFLNYDLARFHTKSSKYLDLVLIHLPLGTRSGACPATWKKMEKYVEQGKIRAIGVSNFKKEQLQRIMDIAKVPIAVNQIEYNLFHHDEETIAFCRANNITVEAYSPLGGAGFMPGPSVFEDETVKAIAAAHNVTVPQVALRWIVQRGDVLTVMSANQAHQANDADLFSFELDEAAMDQLNKLQDTVYQTASKDVIV